MLMEWIAKHGVKLANTFCKNLGTNESQNKLDFWMQNEQQLQKWKIIDYIAMPIMWETRSTVARNGRAQNLTDHWPVMTYVGLPQKNAEWRYENNGVLEGLRPLSLGRG